MSKELKVGNKVIYQNYRSFSSWYALDTIERETATQWVLKGYGRFKKDTLRAVGDRGECIYPMTPENVATYQQWRDEREAEQIWRKIRDLKRPANVPLDRLKAIYAELTATNESRNNGEN